jgi:CHAD domain-containing protein
LNESLSFKNTIASIRERENQTASDAAIAQSTTFSLRKENAKLARENNELHLDHIKEVEHHRSEIQKFQKQLRDLSDEVLRFQMLSKAAKEELTAKEQVIEKLRDVS